MSKLIDTDTEFYNFVDSNRDSITNYLKNSIPFGSIIHWNMNYVFVIKSYRETLLQPILEIVTFSKGDYEKYVREEYSYASQTHCSIYDDGTLRSSQTGQYPSTHLENGERKDVSDYLLEFYKIEKRNLKIEKIFGNLN